MIAKVLLFAIVATIVSFGSSGVVPAVPAAYVAPYASTYNAHVVNHAVAAPLVAAPAPVAAAYVSPYSALPAAYTAYAAAPVLG